MNSVADRHLIHPGISMGVGQEQGHIFTNTVADDEHIQPIVIHHGMKVVIESKLGVGRYRHRFGRFDPIVVPGAVMRLALLALRVGKGIVL